MGRHNRKYLYLVLAAVLVIGMVGFTGCSSSATGANDSGGSNPSSASGDGGSAIAVTVDQLTAGSYSGRSVTFTGTVSSNAGSYILLGSIKVVPQDPACLETIRTGEQVEVKGFNTGLVGGVVTVNNADVAIYCGDETGT